MHDVLQEVSTMPNSSFVSVEGFEKAEESERRQKARQRTLRNNALEKIDIYISL
jgi:hypothetical protein